MGKKRIIHSVMGVVIVQILIISVFLWFGVEGRQTIFTQIPAWNDEDFYFNQIKSILAFGQPLGYYGYDGSHALIGHFGFHGFMILWPYVLVSAIGGLHFYTIAVTNLLLLCAAEIIFVLLLKISLKQAVIVTLLLNSPLLTFYATTEMVEAENYFWAIILAALLVRSVRDSAKINLVYLAVVISLASLCKPTFVIFFVPFWMLLGKYIAMNEKWKYLSIVLIGTGLCVVIFYYIFSICRADYFEGTTQLAKYHVAFDESFLNGIFNILRSFAINLSDPIRTSIAGSVWWYFWGNIYVVLICVLSLLYFFSRKDISRWIPAILSIGTVGGTSILYAGNGRTFYPATVAAALMLITGAKGKTLKAALTVSGFFFAMTFMIKGIWGYDSRIYFEAKNENRYESIERYMSSLKINVDAKTPWQNTLAIMIDAYPPTEYERSSPAGTGINYYRTLPRDKSQFKPSWVLLSKNAEDCKDRLTGWKYSVIKDDGTAILMYKGDEEER